MFRGDGSRAQKLENRWNCLNSFVRGCSNKLKTDMNNPETHSLKQEGDPVQLTKATKKPQTHSLKVEGDSVQPTKATKKPQTYSLTQERDPVKPTKATKKPQTHSLNPIQPIKETEKTKRGTHTQAKEESKMNPATLFQQHRWHPTVCKNSAGDATT